MIHEIVLRFRSGAAMRRIAQSLQISRRTVRRALDQVDQARMADPAPGASPARPRRTSQLDRSEGTIVDLLARYPEITVQRIYEELRRLGYQGSYSLLCPRVQTLRPRPLIAPVRRFETSRGFQAEMDYSTYELDFTVEGRRQVHAFSSVLGCSRRRFAEWGPVGTTFLEGLLAQSRYGKNQAERVLALAAIYRRQDVLAALERAVHTAPFRWRPCSASSRRGASPGRRWRPWPTTIAPIWKGCSIPSPRHLDPRPIIKTSCARPPHMAERSDPLGREPRRSRVGRPRRW